MLTDQRETSFVKRHMYALTKSLEIFYDVNYSPYNEVSLAVLK